MTQHLYRCFDGRGGLLYVGISFLALARIDQHARLSSWFDEVRTVTVEPHATRDEVEAAERAAILAERPKHNVRANPVVKFRKPTRRPAPIPVVEHQPAMLAKALAAAQLLTRAELVVELRSLGITIAESTIATWERERGLPVVRVGRRLKLYRLSEVIGWMNEPERKRAAG